MKKKYLLLLLFLVPFLAKAQENTRKNIVKVNTLSFIFKTTSISYERSWKEPYSFSFTAGIKNTGQLPSIFRLDRGDFLISDSNLNGYMFTPEFRWYLKRCEDAPLMEGFYLAGYFRYNHFRYKANVSYFGEMATVENKLKATLNEFGLGAMLGYQLRIRDWLVADFMFFGPRISRFSLNFEFEQQLSSDFVEQFRENVRDAVDRFFMDRNLDLENTKFNLKGATSLLNIRYGISLGVAF